VTGQIVKQIDDIASQQRVASEKPEVGIKTGGLYMVVACPDMDITTQAVRLLPNDERCFRVSLESSHTEGDVRSDAFQLGRPMEVRSSSKRALISITHATCLPCSAARIRDFTKGVSSPIR
jgi:hypothetical protein